eukprot:scaffold10766_cov95-Skeletonema_dohrnii-CCMP3373.AAC.1
MAFCGKCRYKDAFFSCDDRVEFVMNTYPEDNPMLDISSSLLLYHEAEYFKSCVAEPMLRRILETPALPSQTMPCLELFLLKLFSCKEFLSC